jgi:hypothetical protein
LVDELERHGFRSGLSSEFGFLVTPERVLDPKEATARLHLVTGGFIAPEHQVRDATVLAYSNPLTGDEIEEYRRLERTVANDLRKHGHARNVGDLGKNLAAAMALVSSDATATRAVHRMADIGVPAAVFIEPVIPETAAGQ